MYKNASYQSLTSRAYVTCLYYSFWHYVVKVKRHSLAHTCIHTSLTAYTRQTHVAAVTFLFVWRWRRVAAAALCKLFDMCLCLLEWVNECVRVCICVRVWQVPPADCALNILWLFIYRSRTFIHTNIFCIYFICALLRYSRVFWLYALPPSSSSSLSRFGLLN